MGRIVLETCRHFAAEILEKSVNWDVLLLSQRVNFEQSKRG
jgi:hypothetical protein